jgi:periplasmic protein TonB
MPASPRPVFDSYSLPLSQRRERSAAAVSLAVHVVIALLVLWRGAVLLEAGGGGGTGPRGGGGGGGRQPVSWFALPAPFAPARGNVRPAPMAAVTVPTIAPAPPIAEPVKLDVPPPTVAITTPAAVGTGDGTTGGPGEGPGTGGGKGTGTGTGVGADSGSGSGGAAGDIFAATPLWAISPPPGAPRDAHGKRHEVRFWVTADGRVTRVEVTPPIKDSGYRREFTERMMGYLFKPATTRDGRHVDYIASVTVYP